MKLRIDYSNPTHRLIKTMVVVVTADGIAVPPISGSRAGALLLDVPDTASNVTITAAIPNPVSGSPDVLKIQQSFTMTTPAGGAAVLSPAKPVDLRFTVAGRIGVKGKSPGVFVLKLDLRFLDVTDYAKQLPTEPPPGKVPFSYSPAHGSTFALLECTDDYTGRSGNQAITWCVLIPPVVTAAPSPATLGALLFLRPTIPADDGYTNTDDVGRVSIRLTRYADDPPAAEPFYVTGGFFRPTPPCGFENQLARSNKSLVLFWPLPHVINHGSVVSSRMRDLIRSAMLLLFVGKRLGQVSPLAEFRLALGGFSAGGMMALATLRAPGNASQVDELYMFDPASFSLHTDEVIKWFKLTGKKLRMLAGGYQQQAMINVATTLASSDATVVPDKLDYWYTDSLYKQAVSKPGVLEHFDAVGTSPTGGSATSASNIFLKQYDIPTRKFTLEWTASGSSTPVDKTFPGGAASTVPSHEEAASLVRWWLVTKYNSGAAITKASQFNTVFTRINKNDDDDNEPNRIGSIRHEWIVVGGQGAVDRQAGFKGYLQLCLEQSGF